MLEPLFSHLKSRLAGNREASLPRSGALGEGVRLEESPDVDPRHRIRIGLIAFLVLIGVVFGRVVQLEVTQGPAFRAEAAKPLTRAESLPSVRGRILARNGDVLAVDREVASLAVHYRWLEEPPNPRWLRSTARARLSRTDRGKPERLAAEEARLGAEREEAAGELARLCGVPAEEWRRRRRGIQARVERIAEAVNARQREESRRRSDGARAAGSPGSFLGRVGSQAAELPRGSSEEARGRIIVAEEVDYHVIVDDVPPALMSEIEAHPNRYPGAKTVVRRRRVYPAGRLAAHVLGYLGDVGPAELANEGPEAYHVEDRIGRTGIELEYERVLRGRRGIVVQQMDRRGRVVSEDRRREPLPGRDLVLTLDPGLQQAAEDLLRGALERRAAADPGAEPAGGAVVVMDVEDGAVLAAASAPGFDPNDFSGGHSDEIEALFADPARPLYNRVLKMAIPPGSVFKAVTAVALLEAGAVEAEEPFLCRGYLHEPERWRCAFYTRHAFGHGQVTLGDALCESCNVYFFHHAGRLGPGPLTDWARRFGFGRATGIDPAEESAGTLPTPATMGEVEGRAWRAEDTWALAIGQGSLEATPLQVVRMMAAVANDGRLVTPHVVSGLETSQAEDAPSRDPSPRRIPGLRRSTLATIRQGLRRVVADVRGTAHGALDLDSIAIAAKTGTAETGPGHAAHAWLAGYVPADEPKVAFVVVLEHAGEAAGSAGPVARGLVRRMEEMGYFYESQRTPELAARPGGRVRGATGGRPETGGWRRKE